MNQIPHKHAGKPDIEVNQTTPHRFWQHPLFNLIIYLLLVLASFNLWQEVGQAKNGWRYPTAHSSNM